jgi:hypothetical protein
MANNPDQPAGLEKYVPTTSAAVYLARRNAYYYDSGWTKGGLLLESAAATNLVTYSNDLSQWSNSNSVDSQDVVGVTSPDGTENANSLTETTITDQHGVYIVATVPAGYVTYSVFAKQASGSRYLQLMPRGIGITSAHANFDLDAGTVVAGGTGGTEFVSASIKPLGSGWYRCVMTANHAGAPTGMWLLLSNATKSYPSYAGDGSSGVYIYGAQLEAGSFPTSYIPTSGSTVPRPAETLSIAAADLPYSATAMSISMKGLMTYADEGITNQEQFLRWRIDTNNRIETYLSTSVGTGFVGFQQASAGVADNVNSSTTAYAPGINVPFNIASRHGATFVNGAVDGTALTANTTPTTLADLSATNLELGYTFNGFISEFRMWGTDIGDSGIAEVTS